MTNRLWQQLKQLRLQHWLRVFIALCALSVVVELFIHRHLVHPLEGLFGFYAIYGFVACVMLVLIAKYMRKLLMRAENYYDND